MSEQAKSLYSSINPVHHPNSEDQNDPTSSPWLPGVWRRFPWIGIGALCFAISGTAVMIAVLIASNGRPITDWSVQPSVYLAIATTIVNILIRVALAEG